MNISVISPTHNSADFVADLLESLNNQTISNFELIVVDDRSTDNIEEVILSFSAKFPIKFLRSDGVGPGSARNKGLIYSRSKYVTFVDSDDTLSSKYIEFLYNNAVANDLDISEGLYKIISPEGDVISRSNTKAHLSRNSRISGILDGTFSRIACGKLYRREMLVQNNVFYGEHIHNGEDHIFTLMAYISAKNIGSVYSYLYYWRRRFNSLTKKNIDKKTVEDFIEVNSIKFKVVSDLKNVDDYFLSWAIRFFKEIRVLTREISERSESQDSAREIFEFFYNSLKESNYYGPAREIVVSFNSNLVKDFEEKLTFNKI